MIFKSAQENQNKGKVLFCPLKTITGNFSPFSVMIVTHGNFSSSLLQIQSYGCCNILLERSKEINMF